MAKSFDELVKRTTTRQTRQRAERRTKELLGKLDKLAGKSQQQLSTTPGIKQSNGPSR